MAQSLRGYAHLPQRVYAQQEFTILTIFFTSFYAHQRYDHTDLLRRHK